MLGWLRLDIVKLLVLALPALAIKQLLVDLQVPIGGRSVSAAVLILPILVIGWAIWWWRRRGRPTALGRGYVGFFLVYCLLFAVAADSDVLSGPRRLLAGYEQEVPRSNLGFNRWGDWHYWWVPKAPPAVDLVVVTFDSFAGSTREDVRRRFAFVVSKAVEHQARGVAFDYYLEQPSQADTLLRRQIELAAQAGMPVYFGFRHVEKDGWIVRQPMAPELAESVSLERQGYLGAYLEADDRVRMVPADLPGVGRLESLSRLIASELNGGDVAIPGNRLVQFTEPRDGVHVEAFSPNLDFELWRDRFIVVGTSSESDRVATPFGEHQGVTIHAYAANSLRHSHWIHRLDPRWTFPVLFALCYLLTVLEVRGVPRRTLLATAAGLSVAVLGFAALAVRYILVWVDVSYPLAAVWLLTGLLLGGRRLEAASVARMAVPEQGVALDAAGEEVAAVDGFDVFLSHNGKDKPQVRRIGKALKARGLAPWLDEWELVPGRPWQEALEEIITTARSSAVLVGRDGLGPWEVPEMRASLSECVRRGLPVIPVLLPGAGERPVLPLFLTQYTWVDLRGGLGQAGLDRLEWGITGVKPRGR